MNDVPQKDSRNRVNYRLPRRTWLRLTTGAFVTVLANRFSSAWGQTTPASAALAQFQNPLFTGDYADPSVLRVGHDFYMTHTSYKYAPGLVVWHSRDLVNWTPIANALAKTYGEIWAPDLIHHQNRYYIYYPQDGHLFAVHATNPNGPWSAPVDLSVNGIDPGHVVGMDGTRYLHFAGGNAIQLSADGLSVVGQQKKVYEGWQFPKEWETEGFWLESPKLTRRGDYVYLTSAEGGTSGPPTSHMAVVARSKSPLGPWENSPYNPLIHTYRADEAWWSVGHGTLVSTPDDRWYFVYHGYRNGLQNLGRHTLLDPVEWTADGWPCTPAKYRRDEPIPAPMGVAQRPMLALSDDFRGVDLKATWGAWSETDMSRFRVGKGVLTIRAKGDSFGQSSPLTIMARDATYQVQVVVSPQANCRAGLGLFYNPGNWLSIEHESGYLRVYNAKQQIASLEWKADTAHLRIINRRNRVEFGASEDGRGWQTLATDIDTSGYTTNVLKGFQALRPALAAPGEGEARFTNFAYRVL